ncbi:MAG: hypothetical protein ACRD2J_06835 [Thermoanaerobaculia bacterium]
MSFTLFAALPLLAQDAASREELEAKLRDLEARLERIEAAKAAPSDEIAELRRQIDILTREIERLKVVREAPEVGETGTYGLGAAASKVYRTDHGVSIGGYGEMVYENFDASFDSGLPSGSTDQLDFLRAILYAGYKFNDRVIFNSEIEFEHATSGGGIGEVSVEFAYLDFLLRPELNARAGLLLVPMGLINELHEPTAFLGANRPEVESVIIPSTWRENGAGVFGETGSVSYRAYVMTGMDASDFSASGIRSGRQKGGKAKAEDFAVVGRVDWRPVPGTMIGGSIWTGDSAHNLTTPAGEDIDANLTLGELHADVNVRGWSLRALWASGEIGDVAELNLANGLTGSKSVGEEFGGWYGEIGYDLGAVLPLGDDALIPFARYEEYNTQESVPAGFALDPSKDASVATVGFSWKPIPQAVIKVDYQDYDNAADRGVDQFNIALGYIF